MEPEFFVVDRYVGCTLFRGGAKHGFIVQHNAPIPEREHASAIAALKVRMREHF